MLTPKSVQPGPASDEELVIVVCEDEKGHTRNVYVKDTDLKSKLDTHQSDLAASMEAHGEKVKEETKALAERHAEELKAINDQAAKDFAPLEADGLVLFQTEMDRRTAEAAGKAKAED